MKSCGPEQGAIAMSAAGVVVAAFLPYLFFGDMLPEIPDRLISGLLSGFAASAAIGLVILGRAWRKRGSELQIEPRMMRHAEF